MNADPEFFSRALEIVVLAGALVIAVMAFRSPPDPKYPGKTGRDAAMQGD